MADQNLNIKVSTTGAGKAKQQLGGLNGAISKMGKAVGIAAAAYFGARGLINGFSKAVELAGIQEQAEKKLELALGGSSRALLNQAAALQKVTTFGDEATIQQQAFLASLGFTENKIMDIIPVAMDLASATGMSLESAVRNTAKTFSGLAGELGELVPQIRDLTSEEMKAGKAVKVMGDLFKDHATVEAETMAGALKQAENSAGDLAEAIGERLAPLTRVLAENFTDVIDQLTAMIEADPVFIGPIISEDQQALMFLQKQINEMSFEEARQGANQLAEELHLMHTSHEDYELLNATFNALQYRMSATSQEIKRADQSQNDFGETIKKVSTSHIEYLLTAKKLKNEQLVQDLKSAALQQSSAKDAMKAVVRSEAMEAVAGYIASVLKNVPYPFNLVLAAGGGAIVSGLIDKGLSSFATGGDFVTSGPQMIMVGDNPGGQERVRVDPISSPNLNGSGSGITLNISAPLVDETVVDSIIPAIKKAQRMNLA